MCHLIITAYVYVYKKREVINLSLKRGYKPLFVTQARHQFFDWKLETRRERVPSAPLAFAKSKKTIGSY
jgi:hypothetical protein